MAVQPLSPATDRRLGRPLPHQLSNQTRAHPCAVNLCQLYDAILLGHTVLTSVSKRYPVHKGRLLTRYSPVRHWSGAEAPSPFDLNVLCTPPALILSQDQTLEIFVFHPIGEDRLKSIPSLIALSLPFLELYSLSELRDVLSHLHALYFISYCSIFKDHFAAFFAATSSFYHALLFLSSLFLIFFDIFLFFCKSTKPLPFFASKLLKKRIARACAHAYARL